MHGNSYAWKDYVAFSNFIEKGRKKERKEERKKGRKKRRKKGRKEERKKGKKYV